MASHPRIPVWPRLIALALLLGGALLRADDDKKPAVPDGYKEVKLGSGGSILVKENSDPFQHLASNTAPEKYDPTRLYNHESAMAHKQFASNLDQMNKKDGNPQDQNTFLTQAYAGLPKTDVGKSDLYRKFPMPDSADTHAAADFNKSFATTSSSIARSQTPFPTSASPDQNKTAALTDNKPEVHAYALADKQYLGAGAQKVPEGIDVKENVVIARLGDLPNRPLSIDEVRNLINHGVKPDTDFPPDAPSKALNDPDYQPEPLRDIPPPSQDDKDAPVPAPGTISQPPPENTEALPQH